MTNLRNRLSVLLALLLGGVLGCRGAVVINEFLADNESGSKDRYGKRSDWVEIYNSGHFAVDLAGWGLSDRADRPFLFVFPETNLAARAYLVVRCSGRNVEAVPGEELHANFKLDADGEYLGLVKPSGEVASCYSPYPPQVEDVSYGIGYEQLLKEIVIEPTGSLCQIYVPADGSLGTAWTSPSFDDSRWRRGYGGVGYYVENGEPRYGECLRTEVGEEFAGGRACGMYLHYDFQFDRRTDWKKLEARVLCDDGCVIFVNSYEVARLGVEGEGVPAWNERAAVSRDRGQAQIFHSLDITDGVERFWHGLNEVAVQVLQADGAEEILFDLEVVGTMVSGLKSLGEGYLGSMTPGAANGQPYKGLVAPVRVSAASGVYSDPLSVKLACEDPEAVIRYTLDGSLPSQEHGTVYDGGELSVTGTTVLKAGAYKEGYLPALPANRTYVFYASILEQKEGVWPGPGWPVTDDSGQGTVGKQLIDIGLDPEVLCRTRYASKWERAFKEIPIVSLTTAPEDLFDQERGIYVNGEEGGRRWERDAWVEMLPYGDEPGFNIPCGVRIRGGASRFGTYPKHSFHLYFRTEYGRKKLDYPVFGEVGPEKFDKIDLHSVFNSSWAVGSPADIQIREKLICDLQGSLGHPFKRSRPCHLLLDGQYWGLYWIEERVDENYCQDELGGDKDDYDVIHIGSVQAGTSELEMKLHDLIAYGATEERYLRSLGLRPDGRRNPRWPVLVDPTNLVDITLIYNYTGYEDGPPNNYTALINHKDTAGFKFLCHDCEFALNLDSADADLTEEWSDPHYLLSPWLHQELMNAPSYKSLFVARATELLYGSGPLSPRAMGGDLMKLASTIDNSIILESARWGNAFRWWGGFYDRESNWRPYLQQLRDTYLPMRHLTVVGQFRSRGWYPSSEPPYPTCAPGPVKRGTKMDLIGSGTMVYTLDGSDPLASPSAMVYSGPVTIDHDLRLRAAYRDREYPQAIYADYTVRDDQALVVSEIMSAPGECQFLELYNRGEKSLALRGRLVSGCVSFSLGEDAISLPPGGYAVAAGNLAAFASRYETNDILVLGEFQGQLPEEGGELVLPDYAFRYSGAWLEDPEHSLVLRDEALSPYDYSVRETWRDSGCPGGSPGRRDEIPEPACLAALLLAALLVRRR